MRPRTPEDEALALASVNLARQVAKGSLPGSKRLLYHATPTKNLASILRHGLLLRYAQGKVPAIWLCSTTLTDWAIRHVQRRHGVEAVALLQVRISRRQLAHFGYGRWFTRVDIGPERLRPWLNTDEGDPDATP